MNIYFEPDINILVPLYKHIYYLEILFALKEIF